MPQASVITGQVEFSGDVNLLSGGRVEAYDRDLPSLEQRGRAPQLLGQSPIDGETRSFRIEFTDEQFRQGEATTIYQPILAQGAGRTPGPDLSFKVFDATGRELTIARIVIQNQEYRPDQIIFNAPARLEAIEISLVPLSEAGDTEYEQLIALISPVIQDLPLAELTEEDERFLVNELGFERQLEFQQMMQWLRRSAVLARQTDLPIEAFYGWGRRNVPDRFPDLAAVPIGDLPPVLDRLIALEDAVLSQTLRDAIEGKIIPDLGEQIPEILAQIELIRVSKGLLVARRFIGKLLNAATREPLKGLTIEGFDLDAGQEPKYIGQSVSGSDGVFALGYVTPPVPAGAGPNQTRRRLRLEILLNPRTQEKFETEVQAGGDQDILDISVPIPVLPEPESHQLVNLASTLALELPPDLLPFLASQDITTLADIRKAGGIARLEGLPVAADHPAVQLLEAHTDLSRISPDIQTNAAIIENGYDSVTAIAEAPRSDFVTAIHDRVGDFKAAQLQVAAKAQTKFLQNAMFDLAANHLNELEANNPLLAEKLRCRCRDCEAAVSPLAYLADLIKFITENVKNNGVLVKASDLAATFHQPFDLPASCEAADTQIRQVRLCVEVLRSYLGARPLADATRETDLAATEKAYLLAVYTTLLTRIGTSYAELRLSRTSEPALRQALADRLGIDLSHLNALLLEPDTVQAQLTEAILEQRFGLVDTTRDPLAPSATPEFQSWRLQHLRTLWKQQDFPTDSYEDGQNIVALKELPAGVAFVAPLNTKIQFDSDRQQLVYDGEMTAEERSTLLALSPEPTYQQAIKHLFQISQRLPIIDPDLIGPDDFRRPVLKTNLGDPDQAFDLWKKRRDWVDARLQAFSGLKKSVPVNGQSQQVPDIAAMFAQMYQPVTYEGTDVIAWTSTTPSNELQTLHNQLTQGMIVDAVKFRLQDDLKLPVENFTRLMAIAAKAQVWENDTRNEPVKDEEWQEVVSILVQAQKVSLFPIWRKEESDTGVELDANNFWISLRQPQEGDWPPSLSTDTPIIDPAVVKLKDLPEPIAGERAIALWQNRLTELEQLPQALATERQTNGFDAMLKLALGHPLPHDLDTLKTELSSPDSETVTQAVNKITDDLHLTVDSFKRLLTIKAKNDDSDLVKRPTAAEWAELYAILTPARKINHNFPLWIAAEEDPATGVVYWNALKAKLPRWRVSADTRQLWQQALRDRSQPTIIDPDLIGLGDLKNPFSGDQAFDLWKPRKDEIDNQLALLVAASKDLTGLNANFQEILRISVEQFLAIATSQEQGNAISDRLAQISLDVAEFNYLLRIARLVNQSQPVLELEWENVYSILVQVWKRRQFAQWRQQERDQGVVLSSDFFQIPDPLPIQFPPKEPTVADTWRSSRIAYQEWQDQLQSRIDQEKTIIQALAEAVSATEEATLPMLRDALIAAITLSGDSEAKAKWVTENLLIDARMSGCSMTTRVAQAIETLQGLVLAIRIGQLEDLYKAFRIDSDNFDEKWKWLGSYAAWRSAMFVFLYPENILQPSLRKWQTPAFQALVKNTGANRRLTPQDACLEAKKYSEYFQDICTLQVEASCTTRTRLTKGNECSKSDAGYRCLFYMFGRGGLTGKVYWSTYDFQDGSDYAQSFWKPVEANGSAIKNFEDIVEVIGAVPYQVISGKRYIFLFARKQIGSLQTIECAKYDLEDKLWLDESLSLEITLSISPTFLATIIQQEQETKEPTIIFGNGNFLHYVQKVAGDGQGWVYDKPKVILLDGKPLGAVEVIENFREVFQVNQPFYLFSYVEDKYKKRSLKCLRFQDQNQEITRFDLRHPFPRGDYDYNLVSEYSFGDRAYLGSFSWPGTKDIFLATLVNIKIPIGIDNDAYISKQDVRFWRIQDVGQPQLNVRQVKSPFGAETPYRIAPTSGKVDDVKSKRFVYQTNDLSAFQDQFLRVEDDLYPVKPVATKPSSQAPFDIPFSLSVQALQLRRSLIRAVLENYQNKLPSNLAYLQEAYYFVPLQISHALQQSGEYITALDCLRTTYDYTTKLNERKIYYGLIEEESLNVTYKRAPDWLLDPLNPHLIAATRKNTYTRFTLLTIIRCLLDYANAEFTQDTAESNPRARRLYLTALELLDSEELKQSFDKCDEIIGVLDDLPLPDDEQILLQNIKGELKAISEPHKLQPLVNQVEQVLIAAAPVERRLAAAKRLINEAIADLPSPPNLTSLIEENRTLHKIVQGSLLSDPSLASALESASNLAKEDFQRTVSMVTGISSARLELRPVELPWLRELIVPSGDLQDRQPVANLVHTRRDAAQLDVLTSAYISNLAIFADQKPMEAVIMAEQMPDVHLPELIFGFCIPPNPLLKSLQLRAESNLYKLRTCRNIAGLERQLEPYAAPTDAATGLPTIGAGGQLLLPGLVRLQPTLYRYQVLVERAKQLVQLAAQIEAAFLTTLDKRDIEAYNLLKTRQELNLSQASVQLQNLRISEAISGVELAELQKRRAEIQADRYSEWIIAGLNKYENDMIQVYISLERAEIEISNFDKFIQIAQSMISAAGAGVGAGAAFASAAALTTLATARSTPLEDKFSAEKEGQIARLYADYENRKREWQLQQSLAMQDVAIGDQQITLANDRVEIVNQEKVIAELQTSNAKDTIEFLTTKFTNVNLYEWMSNILEGVYRFFLQQATAMAKLAENQLAFERQEVPPTYIHADYWNVPSDNAISSTPNTSTPDRKGLTGSSRLLQDIYQLDQYAFNTNKRKLQLSKTFSLALLAPEAFQRFRETGVMIFSTPMEMFDRDFPGHYLRLIRRVRTSVIALIPPTEGIHATLTSTGLSRTVIGPDIFQTVPIRRDPEFVALTSPANATGLFELESLQPEFLLPFEGNGVDSSWEFRMPKASNQFDYRTIADVLITIDYTALNSFDYRQQVIQTLNPNLSADRPFSFRNQFSDQWYDLNNPEQTATPMKVKFQTFREDFPPNVETLKIQQVLLYFVRASQSTFELPITELRFTEQGNQGTVGGSATPIDGVISTRRGNAGSWTAMIGKAPVGEWELTLPNTEEVKQRFQNEEIDDILLVITYSGRTPPWPT